MKRKATSFRRYHILNWRQSHLPGLAADAGANERLRLLNRITALPITFLTNTRCSEIKADGIIICDKENTERFIAADTPVLALGVKPSNALFQELHAK